jgi:hypothetical protein
MVGGTAVEGVSSPGSTVGGTVGVVITFSLQFVVAGSGGVASAVRPTEPPT